MSSEIHPKYRPDIDGLRALAILIVVFFHAFPTILTGGFVGVDIFFVISGYLISTIIFKETDKGTFSFRNFYARRINRIFPAFLLVVCTILFFMWLFLFSEESKKFGRDAFNGALFILNVILLRKESYFAPASELKPFLHLWSLAVEEQYYLIWPIIVVIFWKYPRARLSSIIIFLLISFASNIYWTVKNIQIAFYLPFPRFWEFLFGSLLAYFVIYSKEFSTFKHSNITIFSSSRFHNIISVAGTVFIILAAVLLNETTNFPGHWAVLPVLGATLLIISSKSWINKNILSHPAIVFIGLISYPLYLWHWPVLAFARILSGTVFLTATHVIFSLLLSTLLAIATYHFFEKPLRNFKSTYKVKLLILGWALTIIFSLLLYKHYIPTRLSSNKNAALVMAVKQDWTHPGEKNRSFKHPEQFPTLNPDAPDGILVMGDSHAEQYWSRFQKLISNPTKQIPYIRFITLGGCIPLPDTNRKDQPEFSCENIYQMSLQEAAKPNVKTIVISAYWESYFDLPGNIAGQVPIYNINDPERATLKWNSPETNLILEKLGTTIRHWAKQHKTVFIILSNPTSQEFDPVNLISRVDGKMKHNITISKADYLQRTEKVRAAIKALAIKNGAHLIDPVPSLCINNNCLSEWENVPIYKDSNHLSSHYAQQHAGFIDHVLK